jgi:hypothetical protein
MPSSDDGLKQLAPIPIVLSNPFMRNVSFTDTGIPNKGYLLITSRSLAISWSWMLYYKIKLYSASAKAA